MTRVANIDINSERERYEKAAAAFHQREAELQKETGRLVIEERGFTSTKQVKQWLKDLKEKGL